MQSALRTLRETLALGNVSCLPQQFNQDNRLYCALQPAFSNTLFRRGNWPSFVFSQAVMAQNSSTQDLGHLGEPW